MQLNQELKQKLFSDIQRMAQQLLEIKTPSGIVAQFSQIQSLYEKASYLKMDAEWSTMVPHAKGSVAIGLPTPVFPEVTLPKHEPSLADAETNIPQLVALVPPLDSEDHLAIKLADFEEDFLKEATAESETVTQDTPVQSHLSWLKPEDHQVVLEEDLPKVSNQTLTQTANEVSIETSPGILIPEPEVKEELPAPKLEISEPVAKATTSKEASITTHNALDLPMFESCETPASKPDQNVSRETFGGLTLSNTAEVNPLSEVDVEGDFSRETTVDRSLEAIVEAQPEAVNADAKKEEYESKFKLSHIKSLSSKPEAVVSSTSNTVSMPSPKAYLFPQKIVLDLNDRLAFEKHLFAHDPGLLKACVDELNQFQSEEGSKQYLSGFLTQNSINLQNEYAQRLFQLIENKFKA